MVLFFSFFFSRITLVLKKVYLFLFSEKTLYFINNFLIKENFN